MKTVFFSQFRDLLKQHAEDPDFLFVDVRTKDEYADGFIRGVKNIPLSEIEERINEFKGCKSICLHCLTGRRTIKAAELLENQGIAAEIIVFDGGIAAWKREKQPLEHKK